MPDSFYDTIVILFFTVFPIVLVLLQVLFSTRKKLIWGFIVPVLWSLLGTWMIISGLKREEHLSAELLIFFLCGDALLLGITAVLRYLKSKKKKLKNVTTYNN